MKNFFTSLMTLAVLCAISFGIPAITPEWFANGVIILIGVIGILLMSTIMDKTRKGDDQG